MLQWADFEPFQDAEGISGARPLVCVVAHIAGRRMRTVALVDSGADVSFIPHHVAAALKCAPTDFGLSYYAGGRKWPAGDTMARLDLLLSQDIFRIPLSAFLIPEPERDLPFLVLGQDPLFALAEVRFRSWETRVGFRARPRPWMEGGTGGLIGPVTASREPSAGAGAGREKFADTPPVARRSTRRPATAGGRTRSS